MLYTMESLLASDWYRERLLTKQKRELALYERHRDYLDSYLKERPNADPAVKTAVKERQQVVAKELERIRHPSYVEELHGTLGAEPRL